MSKFTAFLAIFVLTACSGGPENAEDPFDMVGAMREAIKSAQTTKDVPRSAPQISRAFLDTVTVPTLEVTVHNFGQTSFLIPTTHRADATRGGVTVWNTGGDENVIIRSGVLIGTKGLGRDLADAEATAVINSISTRRSGGGLRTLHVRNDVNGTDKFRMQCEISVVGPETVSIIEQSYDTIHLNEKCSVQTGVISNDYWIDSAGDVRQSKQWAGPYIGYLSIRLLKK